MIDWNEALKNLLGGYIRQLHLRTTPHQGEVFNAGPWYWAEHDNGAWDGPVKDWETSHRDAYFQHVRKFDVVVQAGGNLGLYPKLLAKRFKTVYTFEPDPLNFFILTMNCQDPNIIKMQAALGADHRMIEMQQRDPTNLGMHQVAWVERGAKIPQLRVDDLALESFDLFLLDIEGYEVYAIHGALESIQKFKPVIVCEIWNNDPTPIMNIIGKFGYKPVHRSITDTVFACID